MISRPLIFALIFATFLGSTAALPVAAEEAAPLAADPVARTAYDRLSYSRKREQVLAIESAKKAETRIRLIEKALATLRE